MTKLFWLMAGILVLTACTHSKEDQNGTEFTAKVTVEISGSGSIVSQDNLLTCSDKCSFTLTKEQSIVFRPVTADNYRVASWQGCAFSDQTQCIVKVDKDSGDIALAVNFERYKSIVSVSIMGNGRITADDGSLDCVSNCSGSYADQKTVTLSAKEGTGFKPVNWTNCPKIVNLDCQIQVGPNESDTQVSVVFERYQNNIVTVQKEGEGTVTASDNSINCGDVCEAAYDKAGQVEYVATAGADFQFLDWLGCKESNGNSCLVDVGPGAEDVTVTARYNPLVVQLYDLTFEAPEHALGLPPTYGFGTKYVTENFGIGTSFQQFAPIITQGPQSQVLTFQARSNGSYPIGDTMSLALGVNADQYRFEWDMQINQLSAFTNYKVFFDWSISNNVIEFSPSGDVTFNSQFVATMNFNQTYHFAVDVDLVKGAADIAVDGQGITGVPLDVMTKDIGSIRFYLFGSELTDSFFIDNLQVKARFNSLFITTPANENNEYVIDFESPPIVSSTGQSGLGVYPYKENNFDITYVLRRDPNINPANIPTNGTVSAGLSMNSRPILYHQYGYAFSLHSVDIADYSTIAGLTRDFTIRGYKQNGDSLSYTVNPSEVSLNFKTFVFGPEWENLNYVIFDGDTVTLDNIVLTVTDKKIQFLPAKLN